jgi:hypothetical protein
LQEIRKKRRRKKIRAFVWVVDAVKLPCRTFDQMRVDVCLGEFSEFMRAVLLS